MVQKTISLPEGVYRMLKAKKRDGDTFADVILRLLNFSEGEKGKKPIETFFGSLDDEDDDWERIEQELYEARDQPRGRQLARRTR